MGNTKVITARGRLKQAMTREEFENETRGHHLLFSCVTEKDPDEQEWWSDESRLNGFISTFETDGLSDPVDRLKPLMERGLIIRADLDWSDMQVIYVGETDDDGTLLDWTDVYDFSHQVRQPLEQRNEAMRDGHGLLPDRSHRIPEEHVLSALARPDRIGRVFFNFDSVLDVATYYLPKLHGIIPTTARVWGWEAGPSQRRFWDRQTTRDEKWRVSLERFQTFASIHIGGFSTGLSGDRAPWCSPDSFVGRQIDTSTFTPIDPIRVSLSILGDSIDDFVPFRLNVLLRFGVKGI